MAGNTKDINLRARLKGSQKVGKGLGRIDKGLKKVAASAIATVGAFMGARMLYDGMKSVINAAKEQELQERKLAAVIKSTGGAAGVTSNEMLNLASALQKQTRFGDEAIIQAQSLMLTFTKVGKDVMPDAIETVLNMSEAMGQDLRMTTIQVGKALNDPILGVTALRRVGVQLSEQQEKQLKDFMAVGDVAGAQGVILGELETQFGGLAKAAGEGLAGEMDKARNAMGDAAEDIGELLAPAIIEAAKWMSKAAIATGRFFDSFQDNAGLKQIIDDMEELNINTDDYRKTLLETEISQLEAKLTQQGLTDSQEDAKKVQKELKEGAEKLKEAIIDEADAEQKLLEADIDSEEQKRKLAKINTKYAATQIVMNAISPLVTAGLNRLTGAEQRNADAKQEVLDTGLDQVIQAEKVIETTKKENEQNQENLKTILEVQKKKEELAQLDKKIASEGEDDAAADGEKAKELMFLTEAQRTQILADAAEERRIIREEEQIGEMTLDAFKAGLELLTLTETQKTAIYDKEVARRAKIRQEDNRKEIQENLETAILNGQSAKEAAKSVIKAEIAEAQASLIASIMDKLPFPINLAVAASAGAMIGSVTDDLLSFQTGGSIVTRGRTTLPIGNGIVAGDNASGMERIDFTPLPAPNTNEGNITININAPVVDEYVVDSIIPAIERARKLNL